MEPGDPVVIFQGPFARLQEIRKLLGSSGIAAEIVQPPDTNANA